MSTRTPLLTVVLAALCLSQHPATAIEAPLDTLPDQTVSAPTSVPLSPSAGISISRRSLPEVTASTVPIRGTPQHPPRLDDPVGANYSYHLARQAAVEGNSGGVETNIKAALQSSPDDPHYQWWQSVQAVKRLDAATLADVLPASFRALLASPMGRGPFVIALHQVALMSVVFFWTVLAAAIYLGWWRNLAHDLGATLLSNTRHTIRTALPLVLPVVLLFFRPGWLGFLAMVSVPLVIQTRGRVRALLLITWATALVLVSPGWSPLRLAVPTIDPDSEVTLLDSATKMPPTRQTIADLNQRLGVASDPGRINRLTVALAIQEARRGNYNTSNKLFTRVLKKDPQNFAALVGRANNLYYRGQLDDAVTAYNTAAAAGPDRGVVPYNLAQVYFKKLFLPEASAALAEARSKGFTAHAIDNEAIQRGAYSPVVYPGLTKNEVTAACRFEAGAYPPLVTISAWRFLLGVPPWPLYLLTGAPFVLALLLVMVWSRQNDPRNCENCGAPLCGNCGAIADTSWLCASCGETAARSKSDLVLATILKNKSRSEGMAHCRRIVRLGRLIPGAGHLATGHFGSGWLRITLVSTGFFLVFVAWAFDPGSRLATPGLQLAAESIDPVWFPLPANLWPGWTSPSVFGGAILLVFAWIVAVLDGPGLRQGISERYSLTTSPSTKVPPPGFTR